MRLPALEKNILVFRALQMTLFLFFAESVRNQLVGSVGRSIKTKHQPELKGSKLLKRIFAQLESDGILSCSESDELQDLLEHRNTIAHDVFLLTGDIELPGRRYGFRDVMPLEYDYEALDRLKGWHEKLGRRLASRYILTISLDRALFEAAEHGYEKELHSLRKRIDRLYRIRRKKNENPNKSARPNAHHPSCSTRDDRV